MLNSTQALRLFFHDEQLNRSRHIKTSSIINLYYVRKSAKTTVSNEMIFGTQTLEREKKFIFRFLNIKSYKLCIAIVNV